MSDLRIYRTHARAYPFTTSMLPAAPLDPRGGPEAYDAVNECGHGRLPSDKSDPCGCWPGEPGYEPPAIGRRRKRATRIATIAVVEPQLDELSPFVTRILTRLNDEIERLTRARDAIVRAARERNDETHSVTSDRAG